MQYWRVIKDKRRRISCYPLKLLSIAKFVLCISVHSLKNLRYLPSIPAKNIITNKQTRVSYANYTLIWTTLKAGASRLYF